MGVLISAALINRIDALAIEVLVIEPQFTTGNVFHFHAEQVRTLGPQLVASGNANDQADFDDLIFSFRDSALQVAGGLSSEQVNVSDAFDYVDDLRRFEQRFQARFQDFDDDLADNQKFNL